MAGTIPPGDQLAVWPLRALLYTPTFIIGLASRLIVRMHAAFLPPPLRDSLAGAYIGKHA
jgi:hypothetical protein